LSCTTGVRHPVACVYAPPQLCTPEDTALASTRDASWEYCYSTGTHDKRPVCNQNLPEAERSRTHAVFIAGRRCISASFISNRLTLRQAERNRLSPLVSTTARDVPPCVECLLAQRSILSEKGKSGNVLHPIPYPKQGMRTSSTAIGKGVASVRS
jgi:hypothetical protein